MHENRWLINLSISALLRHFHSGYFGKAWNKLDLLKKIWNKDWSHLFECECRVLVFSQKVKASARSHGRYAYQVLTLILFFMFVLFRGSIFMTTGFICENSLKLFTLNKSGENLLKEEIKNVCEWMELMTE